MKSKKLSRPQSNQRGIERVYRLLSDANDFLGLNRTSVGLKVKGKSTRIQKIRRPQSNQRGIESDPEQPVAFQDPQASIEPAWD